MSIRNLPDVLQQRVKDELNEIPGRVNDDLNYIKNWLLKQPHINARKDDQSLVNFLRNAKFSLERAKEKIDTYYTMKTMMPELFENMDPFSPAIAELLNSGVFSVIINPTEPLSPVVMVVRWSRINPLKVPLIELLKMQLMFLSILMNEYDSTIINGLHLIEDLEGFSTKLLQQITPGILKKFSMSLQDVFPIRVKGIFVINCPSVMEKIATIVKGLLRGKMQNRFMVYQNTDFKHDDLLPSLLPEEYGGTAGSLDSIAAEWKKKVESYRDWFLNDYQYRTDESKRPGKPKTAEELFGLDGSFRNLDVD